MNFYPCETYQIEFYQQLVLTCFAFVAIMNLGGGAEPRNAHSDVGHVRSPAGDTRG